MKKLWVPIIPNDTNTLLGSWWVFGIICQGGLKEKNILYELKNIWLFKFLELTISKGIWISKVYVFVR